MIPTQRLRNTAEIRAVFGARHIAHGSAMTVHVRRRGDDAAGRAAVIAGRRVGGAVLRNRAKRRLRAALEQVTLPDGVDVVVVAGSGAVTSDFTDLCSQLRRLLERSRRRAQAAA